MHKSGGAEDNKRKKRQLIVVQKAEIQSLRGSALRCYLKQNFREDLNGSPQQEMHILKEENGVRTKDKKKVEVVDFDYKGLLPQKTRVWDRLNLISK